MPDEMIVEKAEIPLHNKECDSCLIKSIDSQNQRRALQALSEGQKKLQGTADNIARCVQGLDTRLEALEQYKRDAETAATVSKVWLQVLTGVGAGVAAICIWWIQNVQKHIDQFGGK